MRISLLPETIRVDLAPVDAALWGGLTAIVKTLDIEEFTEWVDAYPGEDRARTAGRELVKNRLVTVEGADIEGEAYDPKNPRHFRSLFSLDRNGPAAITLIYATLIDRASLGDVAEKN